MSQHYIYSDKVIQAVAQTIQDEVYRRLKGSYGDFGGLSDEDALEAAEAVLRASWDASRIDTEDEFASLPVHTVVTDGKGEVAQKLMENSWVMAYTKYEFPDEAYDLPMYILPAGDYDDQQ